MMIDLDEDELKLLKANIAWLETADPDDWHRVVLDFNWSNPLYVLDWIVRQPNCDRATACTIFWLGEPVFWIDEEGASDEEPNGYSYLNAKICAYIANRVRASGYQRSEIAYSPDTWTKQRYIELVADEEKLENPNFRTHPDLILNRSGRTVDVSTDFYRRYPEAFHQSSYDEQFSDDLEQGLYFTPETRATWDTVQEIEQKSFDALPDWLKQGPRPIEAISVASAPVGPDSGGDASQRIRAMRHHIGSEQSQPQSDTPHQARHQADIASPIMQDVRIDAAALIGNLMVLGFAAVYLKVHAHQPSMNGLSVMGAIAVIGYQLYHVVGSYRSLRKHIDDGIISISDRQLTVAANASFAFGGAAGFLFGGAFSALTQSLLANHGAIALAIFGVVVLLPTVGLAAWFLAPVLLNRRSMRWSAPA